jgi:hypothetical protein
MKRVFFSLVVAIGLCSSALGQEGFVPLFNAKDLSGWKTIRGAGNDGFGPFKIDETENAIHVYANEEAGSKQNFDGLYTEKEYSSFVLKLEYKWLENRFKPRLHHDRDAGVLYHIHGEVKQTWPNCLEMQLGDSDPSKTKDRYTSGDLWVIGEDVQAISNRGPNKFYDPAADEVAVGKNKGYDSSLIKLSNEKEAGQWNQVTVTVKGGEEAIYELNGKVVNRLHSMTYEIDGERVPLTKGRVGLQAEYAEMMYRNIRIKELPVTEEKSLGN